MAISLTFGVATAASASAGSLTSGTFNSTSHTHVVVYTKHEGATTTITPSDNKGTSGWSSLTKQSNGAAGSWVQLHWAKIGTPGTGHTVTMTLGAARDFRCIAAWVVNATSGEISLDDESTASGNNDTPDAGSLVTSAAAVLFMGVAESNAVNYTAGTGWAENFDNPSSGETSSFGESRTEASGGTFDPVCTASGTMDWGAASAAFIESAGGGGDPNRVRFPVAMDGMGGGIVGGSRVH